MMGRKQGTFRWVAGAALAFGLWFASSMPAAVADDGAPYQVLALGDSLTAGYGLGPGEAFPDRLQRWLGSEGVAVTVYNAGVSGDTSMGGRARLDWALGNVPGGNPDLVIVELGGNDLLRGIDPALTHDNINWIVETLAARGIPVLIAGMRAPPNLGPDFVAEFDRIYPEIAAAHEVALYPFFLEGVALNPGLMQADGIHPTLEGIDLIVTRIAPQIKGLLTGEGPGS